MLFADKVETESGIPKVVFSVKNPSERVIRDIDNLRYATLYALQGDSAVLLPNYYMG